MSGSAYDARPWLAHYDYWVPERANFPRQPLYQILMLAASQFSGRTATTFLGAQLSFAELKTRADRLAAALARLGVAKGDRVGILLPNCPQYLIGFFAVVRLGAIVTNINPLYTAPEVARIVADSGLRVLIVLDRLMAAVSGVETVISTSVEEYAALPIPPPPAPAGTFSLSALIAGAEGVQPPRVPIVPEDDVAVLQYTGGTTGTPKGAMLTHYNLYANAIQSALWGSHFVQPGEERVLMVIPYFHIYGLTVGMLWSLWVGAQQIQIPRFDVNMVLDAFRRLHPTSFPGVPTLFISLLNHPEADGCGLESVKSFISGSAPLPVEVIERFEQLCGGTLREGYGLTEASPITHSTPLLARRKPGSVGLPITGTDAKIVDLETGREEMPMGEPGELCVRGPQVMKGYWNQPEETAATLRDGWLYTGDVARMDQDGYFYIVQRKKDLIIVSGFNVYPNEVEEVLFSHPAVLEAAAIGAPHAYRGEEVRAVVVLKPGQSATAEELIAFCGTKLAKFKIPARIDFAESLPKSAVGKVLRRMLRENKKE